MGREEGKRGREGERERKGCCWLVGGEASVHKERDIKGKKETKKRRDKSVVRGWRGVKKEREGEKDRFS